MTAKNFKVSAQLTLSFVAIFTIMFVLGAVVYMQADKIHGQTVDIYNHPLKVRTAIGKLQSDILKMRLGNRDLLLATSSKEQQDAIMMMELAESDAQTQFEEIRTNFQDASGMVDSAFADFVNWKIAREENTRLAMAGDIEKVKESVRVNGRVGNYREKLIIHVNSIDKAAGNKASMIYNESTRWSNNLHLTLIWAILIACLLSMVVVANLLKNIIVPIKQLINVTNRFKNGDLEARSFLEYNNEFGVLSDSFNSMVESIQTERNLAFKTEMLTNAMFSVNNSHKFFRELLPAFAQLTNSQMAAVYLLTEDKAHYVHYESVGLNEDATNHTFSAKGLHGEFGAVLASHKIEYIRKIPHDTQFIFQSVSGKIIPREIITIPILASNEVIAIISLGSIRRYSDEDNQLVEKTFDILTARVEGILTYRIMRKYSKQLVEQNDELEIQRNEMEHQSIELSAQNSELEVQKNQLHEASRLKTNFLSNMSHELRTPLNSVIALSGVLNRRLFEKIPAEEYSYLEIIERNGKHLLSLINDILDISRIEAGREDIEITQFNPNQLVDEIISMLRQQAVQKNVELGYKFCDTECTISSDIDKCRHILQNLIANAVKFTEVGRVEVSILKDNENIKFTVSDTGIGISKQSIEHIFDEFRQADGSTSRRFGGTGLGLAIAKKYAALLGGSIEVESVLDEGSVFTLTMPLNFEVKSRITDSIELQDLGLPNLNDNTHQIKALNKTVVLIEDSELTVALLTDSIEEVDCKVVSVTKEALAPEIIHDVKPDAIVLDLMAHGIVHLKALQAIIDNKFVSQIPVLILTSKYIPKDDMAMLKRSNVHQLVQKKAVNKTEFQNALAAIVDSKQFNGKDLHSKLRRILLVQDKPTVLVVEGNPDNMTTVKAMLADQFNVVEAVDGYDGIAKAKLHKPNLILMDIPLLGLDGIEAFKSIRKMEELQNIPIVALTASAMTTEREAILAYGFDAYLVKPIDDKVFFKTIDVVLYGK